MKNLQLVQFLQGFQFLFPSSRPVPVVPNICRHYELIYLSLFTKIRFASISNVWHAPTVKHYIEIYLSHTAHRKEQAVWYRDDLFYLYCGCSKCSALQLGDQSALTALLHITIEMSEQTVTTVVACC